MSGCDGAAACRMPPGGAPEGIRLTLGTAGHIDHGKTSVVQALTGVWCARLPEEQARGMTINLGFTAWDTGDGRQVGIVDVPGHERFIHNMVAGASGIDAVMLVVAADDGVMPQTVEHVQIVRMLGVRRGVVVINKCDLADEARLAEVEAAIAACVAGTFLEHAGRVRFSAKTHTGLEELRTALRRVIAETAERDERGPFLLHIERSFQLKGLGTIVSGIPRSGTVRIGDELELLPGGTRHRVRGIQAYGCDVATGRAGECVALRLSDIDREAAVRGKVLALPRYFTPHRFMNVRFLYLPPDARPLEPRTAVMFHVGTSETPGHLLLAANDRLAPGAETYAQIQLARPVVAAPGDFYLIRRRSPAATFGGGTVIDCSDTKLRRGRGTWVEDRKAVETAAGDDRQALLLALEKAGDDPCHIDNWARLAVVAPESARTVAPALAAEGAVVALPGDRYVSLAAMARLRAALLGRMAALHDEHPLHRGFERRAILQSFPGSRLVLDPVFADLVADGTLVAEGPRFFLKAREPVPDKRQQSMANNITAIFEGARYNTPRPDSLPARLHATQREVDELLTHLEHRGLLVRLEDHVLLHSRWVKESGERLEAHLVKEGRIDAGGFKELLQASRKFAIPLLEYWDRMGLTRREGNYRLLRKTREKETER